MSVNPYAYAIEGRDVMEVITATPGKLAAILEDLTPEQVETQPAPGKWSPREVLAHLADCEIAFAFRLRQAFSGVTHLQPFDQDAWAQTYAACSAVAALETLRTLRAWNVAFVRGLTEEDKRKPAFHPERGDMTLWTLVETTAGHDLHHLARLQKSEPD